MAIVNNNFHEHSYVDSTWRNKEYVEKMKFRSWFSFFFYHSTLLVQIYRVVESRVIQHFRFKGFIFCIFPNRCFCKSKLIIHYLKEYTNIFFSLYFVFFFSSLIPVCQTYHILSCYIQTMFTDLGWSCLYFVVLFGFPL